ncbi:MAG: spondin domain-containing protein [Pseudomonadota bacterium]
MNTHFQKTVSSGLLVLAIAVLAGCGSDLSTAPLTPPPTPAPTPEPPPPPPPPADATFEVTVSNLTLAQPLSPVAVVLHQSGFNSFVDGETASLAMELMAEGGDNTDVLGEAVAANEHLASASSDGPIPPASIGSPITLTVPEDQLSDVRLTVLTMLVHTNDAFTGANGSNVSAMAVGDTIRLTGPTWDAGTENNDELGASIPGPDFGGEGFNSARDDIIDRVRFHQGAVTAASVESGDMNSDLAERHRFDNPTSRISITRTE